MKIYCILLDTMPFCSEVLEIAQIIKGDLLRQVSGCFTNEALFQMFTGKLTSDLEPGGIGYRLTWNRFGRYKISTWPWMKEFIQFYLYNKGFDFISRNHKEIVSTVLGFGKYPEFYTDASIVLPNMEDPSLQQLLCTDKVGKDYEKDELAYIDKIQQSKGKNIFYLINYCHYHAAVHEDANKQKFKQKCAGQHILKLMKHWDFSESDSLFWIFSDHGAWYNPRINSHPDPQHFYSWVIVRDNSKNPLTLTSKVISIRDFSSYMKLKFDNTPLPKIFTSKERIYLTEDGRLAINENHMTTAIACRFREWQEGFPYRMEYVTYHKPDDSFIQKVTTFDKDNFIKKTKTLPNIIDKGLVEALVQRFDWVRKEKK